MKIKTNKQKTIENLENRIDEINYQIIQIQLRDKKTWLIKQNLKRKKQEREDLIQLLINLKSLK
jgi:hypothetical protein